jgi:hypothetical protein
MSIIWKGCNDQVILNVLIRSNILTNTTTTTTTTINGTNANNDTEEHRHHPILVKVHQQGYGPMNVLGHGGKILRNENKKNGGSKFLNRNCIVSPVVHQYDLVRCSK